MLSFVRNILGYIGTERQPSTDRK